MVEHQNLPSDLKTLAETANEELEGLVNEAVNRAFNLGCFVGLVPAALFALVTFLVTGPSVTGAAIALLLAVLGLVAFANLAATITRRNAMPRRYRADILPNVEAALKQYGYTMAEFQQAVHQTLPQTSLLARMMALNNSVEERSDG